MNLLIKNGRVVFPDGIFEADVAVDGEQISAIGKNLSVRAVRTIDARGKLVLPGIVDAHVHLELPFGGEMGADDFNTGTISGAYGGVTTIVDYAIQRKGDSLLKTFEERKKIAEPKVVTDFSLHVSPTDVNENVLKEIGNLVARGVTTYKMFFVYRKEGLMVDDGMFYAALLEVKKRGGLISAHCENSPILEYLTEKLVSEGKVEAKYFPLSRPNFVESETISRAIAIAEAAGAPFYIPHMSTKEGLWIVREARKKGLKIYSETCPHYLLLNDDVFTRHDGINFICCPPIRKKEDNEEYWRGVVDGSVQVIGTDEAPWTIAQKKIGEHSFDKVPPGLPGIETSLPLIFSEGVMKRGIPASKIVELMSFNPARITGMFPKKGIIAPGSDADIVIVDPKLEKTVKAPNLHSNCDWTPFEGMKVKGWPVMTISRGTVIVEGEDFHGKPGAGRFIERKAPLLF